MVGVDDFNGDLQMDLIFQHNDGTLAVWLMIGVGLASASLLEPSHPDDPQWRLQGVGDFNGDGQVDLAFEHADGTLAVWFLQGTRMASASLLNPAHPGDVDWRVAVVNNLNQDGRPDLIFQHARNQALAVWFMNGINLGQAKLLNPSTPVAGWHPTGP